MRLKYIKKLSDKDKKVLMAMAKCGYVGEEELLKIVTANRIYSFMRESLIIKDGYYHEKNRIIGYRLSEKGNRMVKEVLGINYIQHAQTVLHDNITSRFYLNLPEDEQQSFKCESEIKEMLEKMKDELEVNKEYSALDGVYMNKEGIWIGVEAVVNYPKCLIEEKKNTCDLFNWKYEERRRKQ